MISGADLAGGHGLPGTHWGVTEEIAPVRCARGREPLGIG